MTSVNERDSGFAAAPASAARKMLDWEILPDPQGFVSFTAMMTLVAAHLLMAPDRDGFLFGEWSGLFSGTLRRSLIHETFEGFLQACLLVGPLVVLYASVRHLRKEADSLLPYLTLTGAGFLTLLTCIGLVLQAP